MTVRLLTGETYVKAVVAAIGRARRRVYVAAFVIQPCAETKAILAALTAAEERGVTTSIVSDVSTFHYTAGRLSLAHIGSHATQSLLMMTRRFRTPSASIYWAAQHSLFLYAGRMHSKWIVADDDIFCFGGINLDTMLGSAHDYMLSIHDEHLANIICTQHDGIIRAESLGSATLSRAYGSRYGTVLVDGGVPGDSIIYRHALRLVRQAASVQLVTQYCPSGRLAISLQQTPYRVFYNQPLRVDRATKLLIRSSERRYKLQNSYTHTSYIHAKFLIATMPDGKKIAITGSHNFINHGMWLGTREIALETTNKTIIAKLEQFLRTHIA